MTLLEHEVHPYVEDPMAEIQICICGLFRQHHLHAGISSAVCCCAQCIGSRDPEQLYGPTTRRA